MEVAPVGITDGAVEVELEVLGVGVLVGVAGGVLVGVAGGVDELVLVDGQRLVTLASVSDTVLELISEARTALLVIGGNPDSKQAGGVAVWKQICGSAPAQLKLTSPGPVIWAP